MPNPGSLADWLDYQQRTHPRAIELGLERVREVWRRLGAPAPAPVVITVGGTNGKGSTVAFLEAMLGAAGKRVGAYTSPHLLRYNERVRVAGVEADDAALVDAFARIEAARGADSIQPIPLTYFEFGTLAALLLFADSALDVAVLEVGLGGRLDAVNLIDADAAIVTTVDLDHQDWLGNDRDSIGREKAGIFRAGRAAIVGERVPPRGLLDAAARTGAELRVAGRDFQVEVRAGGWRWHGWPDDGESAPALDLPRPGLAAACQLDNAAAAIAALYALRDRLGWHPAAIARGVADARVGARLQRFGGLPELIVDVAHNPQAARVLADWLRAQRAAGRTLAVFGALGDKDVRGVHAALAGAVDDWFLAGLDGDSPRGLAAPALGALLGLPADTSTHATVADALAAAFAAARPGDRVLAFGSFFVAAAALEFAQARGLKAA
ncbi:MAG: bifunctional tetrahydrofolate synthase/dihydrofolate synthase [Rhodanobacteraceae bacterium]|nr:bifunctional tetrahydrofolate synthase/dihydrofolate synthase [Rhodanobacteraceae bacterium]